MKNFLFLYCLGLCISLTSCSWFDNPANAEYIGSGYIRNDRGIYYVEINSIRYSPHRIYTNSSSRDGKNTMAPVEGMKVTCFRLHGNPKIEFIAGEHSEEYLDDYFTTNATFVVVLLVIMILCISITGITFGKNTQKVHIIHDD